MGLHVSIVIGVLLSCTYCDYNTLRKVRPVSRKLRAYAQMAPPSKATVSASVCHAKSEVNCSYSEAIDLFTLTRVSPVEQFEQHPLQQRGTFSDGT